MHKVKGKLIFFWHYGSRAEHIFSFFFFNDTATTEIYPLPLHALFRSPKKPPPLVPNSLMTSCDATGPCAMICCVTVCVVTLPSAPVTCTVCGSIKCTGV